MKKNVTSIFVFISNNGRSSSTAWWVTKQIKKKLLKRGSERASLEEYNLCCEWAKKTKNKLTNLFISWCIATAWFISSSSTFTRRKKEEKFWRKNVFDFNSNYICLFFIHWISTFFFDFEKKQKILLKNNNWNVYCDDEVVISEDSVLFSEEFIKLN